MPINVDMDELEKMRVDEYLSAVKARIRARLEAAGISIGEASVPAGLNPQYLSKALSERSKNFNPSLGSLAAICICNGIDPTEIFVDPDSYSKLTSLNMLQRSVGGNQPDLAERLAESFKNRKI